MEKLLELDDITLYPSEINNGIQLGKYNFGIIDELDNSNSLPIFTAPIEEVVCKDNWKIWNEKGIKPILPNTEDIQTRLEGCQYIFTSFLLSEIKEHFIGRGKRSSSMQFKICINEENGENGEILNVASQLKKMYGNQINIMAGNIGNPKTYLNYCKYGIDYARVGLSSSTLFDYNKYGFYYPLASLLIDINGLRATSAVGLKQTKVIADGGVSNPVDILKCLALGADYVMCGRTFSKLLEASGSLHKKEKNESGEDIDITITITEAERLFQELGPKNAKVYRMFYGNRAEKVEWVRVDSDLKNWLTKMYDVFNYAFSMSNSVSWKSFKSNIKFGRIQ